jgi:hypothetical protein
MKTYTTFVTAKGVPMVVRIVFPGENYGLKGCLVNEKEPMVEFYDARYDHNPWLPFVGQFISRYYVSTLLENDRGQGLCLDGGIPAWDVDAASLKVLKRWVAWRMQA